MQYGTRHGLPALRARCATGELRHLGEGPHDGPFGTRQPPSTQSYKQCFRSQWLDRTWCFCLHIFSWCLQIDLHCQTERTTLQRVHTFFCAPDAITHKVDPSPHAPFRGNVACACNAHSCPRCGRSDSLMRLAPVCTPPDARWPAALATAGVSGQGCGTSLGSGGFAWPKSPDGPACCATITSAYQALAATVAARRLVATLTRSVCRLASA